MHPAIVCYKVKTKTKAAPSSSVLANLLAEKLSAANSSAKLVATPQLCYATVKIGVVNILATFKTCISFNV